MPHPDLPVTEAEWQQQVVELLGYLGWKHLHVRRSIGKGRQWATTTSRVGWPDLFAWHPTRGFVAIELKVGNGKLTTEQREVLDELAVAGARVMVAWPSDLGALTLMLRTEPSWP